MRACVLTVTLLAWSAPPLKWRNIGPNRGGRSLATAGSPAGPHEYYFGAVGGGLWKRNQSTSAW